jgi:hypothetical protein
MSNPYADLPPRAFWRSGVAMADRSRFPGLYEPRLTLTPATAVATAGSCFAQHISRHLRRAGCVVLDAEPAPAVMPEPVAQAFGYGVFSGRYGNIYTPRQMRQLLEDVLRRRTDPRFVWARDGAYVDAFRPTVEPEGHSSPDEVLVHRTWHLHRVLQMLRRTDLFVFTLGLTECWEDRETGRVFPVCPGIAGGTFNPDEHVFRNFRTTEIIRDLTTIHTHLHRFNPNMQMLLTVSPVPLTATNSGDHVLTASAASKAILRAAADEFVKTTPGTDYFPAFEIVTHPASGGPWFEPNMRSVSAAGVEKVMDIFLSAHGLVAEPAITPPAGPALASASDEDEENVSCDEVLLDAFANHGPQGGVAR